MKDTPQKQESGFISLINGKWQFIIIPVLSIICSLAAGAIIIAATGKNPLTAYYSLLQGAGIIPKSSYAAYKGVLSDLMSMISAWTPMLFAALAVAVAFKAGLFNIGVSGQMLLSGFIASIIVGYSGISGWIAMPLVIIIGIIIGAAVGCLIGILKYKFNINEVVSSIMINYILSYVTSYFINTRFIDTVSRQSKAILPSARLVLADVQVFGLKIDVPLFMPLALICAFGIWFILKSTTTGYEIKAVGFNRNAAGYAGIRVGLNITLAMTASGALAGLAGVTYYLGYYTSILPKSLSSLGFDAIAVSLLGNSHPIGIIFSSLLITIIDRGSSYMRSSVGVEQEISSVITGMILLFSACGAYIRHLAAKGQDRRNRREADVNGNN